MAKRSVFTWQECPDCEGFGIAYCLECEARCDHDDLCKRCKGNQEIVVEIPKMVFFGVWLNKPDLFWETRKVAQTEIDTFDMHGRLR